MPPAREQPEEDGERAVTCTYRASSWNALALRIRLMVGHPSTEYGQRRVAPGSSSTSTPKGESMVTAPTVHVQKWERGERLPRWAYVVSEPGEPLYVSPYRYQSALAAQRAGERDAAGSSSTSTPKGE